jgi:hypothetical protein
MIICPNSGPVRPARINGGRSLISAIRYVATGGNVG